MSSCIPAPSDSLDERPRFRHHVDGLALEFGQRLSEGEDAISERSALVNQHERLAPHDAETATHGCRRLEGLDAHLDSKLFCGPEQFVKEMRVVHLEGLLADTSNSPARFLPASHAITGSRPATRALRVDAQERLVELLRVVEDRRPDLLLGPLDRATVRIHLIRGVAP